MPSDPSDPLVRITIADDPPRRLDKALARDVPDAAGLSRTRIARLIAEGQVTRGEEILQDPKARVWPGDEITLRLPESAEIAAQPEAIPLDIVHEDAELIVVDKPAGMVVHPAPGTPSG
ncbi:MAG: RNA pseudouridine synthase, partial [Pseudomonadota bacterium]